MIRWSDFKARKAQAQIKRNAAQAKRQAALDDWRRELGAWLDEYQHLLTEEALTHFEKPPRPACVKLIAATAGMVALIENRLIKSRVLGGIHTDKKRHELTIALDSALKGYVRLTGSNTPLVRSLLARKINEQRQWARSSLDLMNPVGHA